MTAKDKLEKFLKDIPVTHPHKWEEIADMIRENCGIADANCFGFTIVLLNGDFHATFEGGLTREQWNYFAPLLDSLGQVELAKGVVTNMMRTRGFLLSECDCGWRSVVRSRGDEEIWLPEEATKPDGFEIIAQEMERAILEHRKARPPAPEGSLTWVPTDQCIFLRDDVTGLIHTADYRVCKDPTGTSHTCNSLVAILIRTLNQALREGATELPAITLVVNAMRLCAGDEVTLGQLRRIHLQILKPSAERAGGYRLDHKFRDCDVWGNLVDSEATRGSYRLVVVLSDGQRT